MKLGNLALALGLAFSVPAWASHVECINSNIDIYNRTGQDANDLEIRLGGITAAQVGSSVCGGFYTGVLNPFGAPTVTEDALGVTIRWAGVTVASGGGVHVGYSLIGNPAFNSYSVTWTSNGVPIPPPPPFPNPDPGQFWNGQSVDNLTNFGAPVWVQRRGLTSPGVVTLSQLMVGGAIDLASTAIDASPVYLGVGANLLYTFATGPDVTESYVMIYDVYADNAGNPGVLLATYLNDQVFIPEPASLALLGLAGLAGAVARRRQV